MAKIRDYNCRACGENYEFTHHPNDEPAICPKCGSQDAEPVMGGRVLTTIIPVYPNCKRVKAGYVHTHGDRPREKISVSVPRPKGE